MPQMFPILWFMLFISILSISALMSCAIHFTFTKKESFMNCSSKSQIAYLSWKW